MKKRADDDTGNYIAKDTQDEESEDYGDYEGFAFVQGDVLCSIQDNLGISNSCILLDSQSSIDIFCNPKLLSNIHDVKHTFNLYCNSGRAIISKKGDLKGYGMVWYHPEGIANILSLHNVQRKHKVTYDSSHGIGFVVNKADGACQVFMSSSNDLFFSDVKGDVAHFLINTVDRKK